VTVRLAVHCSPLVGSSLVEHLAVCSYRLVAVLEMVVMV
jgi:hypothetical protein